MNKASIALICGAILIVIAIIILASILTLKSNEDADSDKNSEFECGLRYVKLEPRLVINGSDAPIGSAPWFVSIRLKLTLEDKQIDVPYCGGSIIAPEWVITATHCIVNIDKNSSSHNFCVQNCIIIAGSLQRMPTNGSFLHGTTHKIVQQFPFDMNYTIYGKDIALLKVSPPFEYRKPGTDEARAIAPVCLPEEQDEPLIKEEGDIVGFGVTNDTLLQKFKQRNNTNPKSPNKYRQNPDFLQIAHVRVITRDECVQIAKENLEAEIRNISNWKEVFLAPQATICAGNLGEHQLGCQGDSGGPLTVEENRKSTLIGVTHAGITEYCSADPVWYTVFTRVSHFRNWIKQIADV